MSDRYNVFVRMRGICKWHNRPDQEFYWEWQEQCLARRKTERKDTRCKVFNCPALMKWPGEDLRELFPDVYGPIRDDSRLPS